MIQNVLNIRKLQEIQDKNCNELNTQESVLCSGRKKNEVAYPKLAEFI